MSAVRGEGARLQQEERRRAPERSGVRGWSSTATARDQYARTTRERERVVINRMMRNGDTQVLSLRDAMDRLMEQSFTPFGRGFGGESGNHTVPSNLWEDGNTYYLNILAPSLDLSSVDITVVGGILTVSGQTSYTTPEGAKSVWQEWGPTSFRRQIQLPSGFDAERCEATYKDGVLTVTVPKPEQIKPKAIKVQVKE
jgi:HSP20 family protein